MGFRFPREYVRDGPGFFFSIIKTKWRYRFLHDCSPLVGRLLVAACCIAYITLIEVRFLLPTKSFFIVFFLLHFALVVWPFFFVLFAVPFFEKTKKQKLKFKMCALSAAAMKYSAFLLFSMCVVCPSLSTSLAKAEDIRRHLSNISSYHNS